MYSLSIYTVSNSSISKELKKMQRRAALWITEVFYISLSWEVEAIAGLIPIYFHLNKISGWHHL